MLYTCTPQLATSLHLTFSPHSASTESRHPTMNSIMSTTVSAASMEVVKPAGYEDKTPSPYEGPGSPTATLIGELTMELGEDVTIETNDGEMVLDKGEGLPQHSHQGVEEAGAGLDMVAQAAREAGIPQMPATPAAVSTEETDQSRQPAPLTHYGESIHGWVARHLPDLVQELVKGPPAGAKDQKVDSSSLHREDAESIHDSAPLNLVQFIRGQCCPIVGCPCGPDGSRPVHQQKSQFTKTGIILHYIRHHLPSCQVLVCLVCGQLSATRRLHEQHFKSPTRGLNSPPKGSHSRGTWP